MVPTLYMLSLIFNVIQRVRIFFKFGINRYFSQLLKYKVVGNFHQYKFNIVTNFCSGNLTTNKNYFLAELLQTALLFKWKYFLTKSHGVSQDLRISSVLIGSYSGHMTKNETLRDFRLNETLQK